MAGETAKAAEQGPDPSMQRALFTRVISANAPAPLGHYEQALLCGNTLYLSGLLGVDTTTETPAEVSLLTQTEFALHNLEAILKPAGCDRSNVVRMTIFVDGVEGWRDVNRACAEFFGEHKPARSIVPVGPLRLGARIEIEATAAF